MAPSQADAAAPPPPVQAWIRSVNVQVKSIFNWTNEKVVPCVVDVCSTAWDVVERNPSECALVGVGLIVGSFAIRKYCLKWPQPAAPKVVLAETRYGLQMTDEQQSAAFWLTSVLPPPVVALINRILFFPTLLFNLFQYWWNPHRWAWYSKIDDTIVMGALPFSWDVPMLHEEYGVKAVVNCIGEYIGPVDAYDKYDIEQLWIPVADYAAPTLVDIDRALFFIERSEQKGKTVLVHCKAGRGRSATIVICYLMNKLKCSAAKAQQIMDEKRPQVTKTVYLRKVVKQYEARMEVIRAEGSFNSVDLFAVFGEDTEGPDDGSTGTEL